MNGKRIPSRTPARPASAEPIQKATDLGYSSAFGMEFEWFNFAETPQSWADKRYTNPTPITPGMFGYSILRASHGHAFFNAMLDQLVAGRARHRQVHRQEIAPEPS